MGGLYSSWLSKLVPCESWGAVIPDRSGCRFPGVRRSWLIRPEPEWFETWIRDSEAERLHRLSRDYLLAHGCPRSEVAQELASALNGHEPLSDNPAYEQY